MKARRGLRTVGSAGVLVGFGLSLRWGTAGTTAAASSRDLLSMAVVAIGAISWIAYGWLVLAMLVTALERMPGAIGRSAAVVAGCITSRRVRAALGSALGVAAVTPLTVGIAQASPAPASPTDSGQPPAVQRLWTEVERPAAVALTDGRRGDVAAGRRSDGSPRQPIGAPDRPTEGTPPRSIRLPSASEQRPEQFARSPRHRVVQPGDSLWNLVAAELGPEATAAAVAERWPQWYAANHAVIGADPDLLVPGQVLRVPARGAKQSPAQPPGELR